MTPDEATIADVIVQGIKAAMKPRDEKIAALEQRVKQLEGDQAKSSRIPPGQWFGKIAGFEQGLEEVEARLDALEAKQP